MFLSAFNLLLNVGLIALLDRQVVYTNQGEPQVGVTTLTIVMVGQGHVVLTSDFLMACQRFPF